MSLGTSIKGTVIGIVLKKLSDSEPKTTALGATLGGLIAAQIDYSKLLQGDPTQIGNAVAAVVVTLLGYFTNNKKLVKQQPLGGTN
jgi:hypothetical protein